MAVALVTLACSSPNSKSAAEPSITLADRVELDQTDEHVVASVADVLTWNESLVVVDRLEANVKLFSPTTGALLRVIGRRGQGPGEFLVPDAALTLSDGRLVVRDALLQRLCFFGPGGNYLSSWSLPGFFTGGPAETAERTLLLTGGIISEGVVTPSFELHEFDMDGHLLSSSERLPEPQNFGESGFDDLLVSVAGDTRLTLRRTTNLVRAVSLVSGREREFRIGLDFYRPPVWDLQPGDTPDDAVEWQKRQVLAWYLRAVGPDRHVAGFVGSDTSGAPTSWWVVIHPDEGESVITAGAEAVAGPGPDGSLAIVDITASGAAMLEIYDVGGVDHPGAL